MGLLNVCIVSNELNTVGYKDFKSSITIICET